MFLLSMEHQFILPIDELSNNFYSGRSVDGPRTQTLIADCLGLSLLATIYLLTEQYQSSHSVSLCPTIRRDRKIILGRRGIMLLCMTQDCCEVECLATLCVTQSELSLFPNLSRRQDSQSAENTGFRVRRIRSQVLVLPTYQPQDPAKLFKLPDNS